MSFWLGAYRSAGSRLNPPARRRLTFVPVMTRSVADQGDEA